MPEITDPLPDAVKADVLALRQMLAVTVPPKLVDDNLLVATWNIRAFGDLTRSWASGPRDEPKRDLHALACICEILQRFDIIAVQEVRSNLRALRHALKRLGPHWGFLLTDVTYGAAGNGERLAYLYDSRRVKLSGLAGELVVPDDLETPFSTPANAFQRQFARTPYAVSFQAGRDTLILVTLHVIFGQSSADRTAELTAIARWLRAWSDREAEFGHNLIALGDFNIDRQGDANWQAFTSTGLTPAPGLDAVPRTLFDKKPPFPPDKFYDQIAWFVRGADQKPALDLLFRRSGYVGFDGVVLRQLSNQQLSWRLSDHYPLWVEFGLTPDV